MKTLSASFLKKDKRKWELTFETHFSQRLAVSTQFTDESHILEYHLNYLFLAGLNKAQPEEADQAPSSRLALLLKLSVTHSDGFQMHEADRKYMEGWQHALIVMRSKYITFASDPFHLNKRAYTH